VPPLDVTATPVAVVARRRLQLVAGTEISGHNTLDLGHGALADAAECVQCLM
jgi:hypothetical protein